MNNVVTNWVARPANEQLHYTFLVDQFKDKAKEEKMSELIKKRTKTIKFIEFAKMVQLCNRKKPLFHWVFMINSFKCDDFYYGRKEESSTFVLKKRDMCNLWQRTVRQLWPMYRAPYERLILALLGTRAWLLLNG